MKKYLLIAALLPLGCQTQFNPANCIVGPACGPGQLCDPITETCQTVTLSLTSIEPASGAQRAATLVTITGTGFQAGITVQVNGVAATQVSVLSSTRLTALVPASSAVCGPVKVHLTNPDNTAASRGDLFRYLGGGPPRFSTPALTGNTQVPGAADQIIIRDLNGDAYEDLAIKSPSGSNITLCEGNSAGMPVCNASIPYTLNGPSFMRIHDFERNGKPNILLTLRLSSILANGLLVKNPGSLTETWEQSVYNLTTNIADLIAVDRPGAELTDLFVATTQQLASAPFAPGSSFAGKPVANEALRGLLAAQLDPATPAQEIVAVRGVNAGLVVLEQATPDASYVVKWQSALQVGMVRLADVNGDGKLDLLGFSDSGASVYLVLGQGDGTFGAPAMMTMSGVTAPLLEVADLACDGNQELVVASGKNVAYVQLRADGTVVTPVPIAAAGSVITGLAVKDLNGDGRPEVVYTTATTGLSVVPNLDP
ncbi:MAG TPA: FG-GAP-like repeat-containing protein [Pseudomonadota bacterium]|nr:FG-GAP-like repeat-containing protein [Pseudomonadota bacterium]